MFLILAVIAFALLFYYFLLKPQLFWWFQNVKQGPPIPIFGDTVKSTFKIESMVDFVTNIYKRCKNLRYCGLYQTTLPILLIRDTEIIKQITVKDFDHFTDHWNFIASNIEPIWSKNLFSLKGDQWRAMRATLSPTFTSSKMRLMFELMEKSAQQYVDFYLKQDKNIVELELKDSFTRFANDVIANCAFGITVDSLKEPENDFYMNGKEATSFVGFWKAVKFIVTMIAPKLAGALKLSLFSPSTTEFFRTLVRETVKVREDNNIVRPDMINLLMEARKGKLHYEESSAQKDAGFATVEESNIGKTEHLRQIAMTDDDMAAQVLIFFFAGFETISIMMSFMCYELAVNPDIQEKLREEVDRTIELNNGKLSYDVLNKMKYMDMVTSESLRKNPPVMAIDRVCTRAYTIPPERPGEKPVHLKPGQIIWLPVHGIHHDEELYPNPSKFIPERFSEENKDNIKPYTFLSFGSGPRNCIGSRFALMEVKTLVFHILSKFELAVIDKTTIPLKYDRYQFNPSLEGGFWIGFKRRTDVKKTI